jgi:peptide/nickel transport system substrate-binding protein
VNQPISPKEFRLKGGNKILDYLRQFSATEKVVFGVLIILAGISTLLMTNKINSHLVTEIPGYGGTLHEGVVGLPRTINPVLAVTDVDRDLSNLIYSGLMRQSEGKLIPDLAKSYKISDDGLVYTFILNDRIHFHDGQALTAEDIAFTIQKIQDPALKSPRKADWANVTTKVLSPNSIEFILKQPYSPFLSNTTIGVLPKHIWKDVSNDQFIFSEYNIDPIGSGPFKAKSILRDKGGIPIRYTLSVNKDYNNSIPFLKSIEFHFFADEEKALSALDNGEIDSLPSISSGEAARLASNKNQGYNILSAPLPRIFGVFFNQSQSTVLADINVRKALNLAVDRQNIIDQALDGYGQAIEGPFPIDLIETASSSGSISNPVISKADIASAKTILEAGGWKKNTSTGIYEFTKKGSKTVQTLSFDIYTADSADLKLAAELIKADWTALGADVSIKIFEASDLYQNIIRTRKYDALLFGQSIGKDRDLYAFWHSSQRNQPGLNIAMYTNSKADKILEDIRTIKTNALLQTKYKEFQKLIAADIPAIFLYSPDFIYAVPKRLKDINLTAIDIPSDRLNSVSKWYINIEKVWKIFVKN